MSVEDYSEAMFSESLTTEISFIFVIFYFCTASC